MQLSQIQGEGSLFSFTLTLMELAAVNDQTTCLKYLIGAANCTNNFKFDTRKAKRAFNFAIIYRAKSSASYLVDIDKSFVDSTSIYLASTLAEHAFLPSKDGISDVVGKSISTVRKEDVTYEMLNLIKQENQNVESIPCATKQTTTINPDGTKTNSFRFGEAP